MAFNYANLFLVADVGNTNITLGLYSNGKLLKVSRKQTDNTLNTKELSGFISDLLISISSNPKALSAGILASVVPQLNNQFEQSFLELTGNNCYIVNHKTIPGITFEVEFPSKVGIDRLIATYEVFRKYETNSLVIDMGTATTFDLISSEGAFIGGVIAPGMKLGYEALIEHTAQLPKVDFVVPKSVIGKNTQQSIQSGIIFGYAGLVDSMAAKITYEFGKPLKIIATGGLANIIAPISTTIDIVLNDLMLSGLYRLLNHFENRPEKRAIVKNI